MSALVETRYVSGKVRKLSLPLIEGAPAPESPLLKRLLLPQGELAQLHDDDDHPIHYIAFIELRAGTVRGNHYHLVKEEFIYVFRGLATLHVGAIDSGERASFPMAAGDLAFIPTRIAHALCVEESGQGVEFSSTRFNNADTHRHVLTPAS
jgi:hypothetical protein